MRKIDLRREIANLRETARNLEDFDLKIAALKRKYLDLLDPKNETKQSLWIIRHDIQQVRAHFLVCWARDTIAAHHVELAFGEVQLVSNVATACLASREGSAMLRDGLSSVNPMLQRWVEETYAKAGAADQKFTISDAEYFDTRDALETALADTSALEAWDHYLLSHGDAGRGGFVVGRAVIEQILNRLEPASERPVLRPESSAFRKKLTELLAAASDMGFAAVEVNAGHLHKLVSGHAEVDRRIPICGKAMLLGMRKGDRVVTPTHIPVNAIGWYGEDRGRLTVRYRLPRPIESRR